MPLGTTVTRLLLIGALVAAQHTALAHGVWHSAGAAQQSGHDAGALCDLHSAFGTVLGAIGNAASAPPPAVQGACTVPAATRASAAAALVTPSSRDPPLLS